MSDLHPCVACKRHIRTDERTCPFCSSRLGEDFALAIAGAAAAMRRPLTRGATRAALLFAGATAIASCTSGVGTTSGGTSGSTSGEPAYGGPPIDVDSSTKDAPSDATQKFDGPVALYGPAPVDAGDG
jgi:hypothetical protein